MAALTFPLETTLRFCWEQGSGDPAMLEWGTEFARLFLRAALQLLPVGGGDCRTNTDSTALEREELASGCLQGMTAPSFFGNKYDTLSKT